MLCICVRFDPHITQLPLREENIMKKLLCLVLELTMLMSLALISPAAAEDWKFERKIEIVCP